MGPTARQCKPASKLLGYWPEEFICRAKAATPSKVKRQDDEVRRKSQRCRFIMYCSYPAFRRGMPKKHFNIERHQAALDAA
jgi:hypothetical protein